MWKKQANREKKREHGKQNGFVLSPRTRALALGVTNNAREMKIMTEQQRTKKLTIIVIRNSRSTFLRRTVDFSILPKITKYRTGENTK